MTSIIDSLGIALARQSWRVHRAGSFTGSARVGDAIFKIPVQHGMGLALLTFTDAEHRFAGLIRSVLAGRDGAIVDVGANIGRFLLYAMAADSTRRYVGFDVHTACAHYVDQLIAVNGFENAVIFPVGLSETARVILLQSGSDTDVSASVVSEFYPADRFALSRPVVVDRGDAILAGIDSPRIALLKIDVEGGELDVIRGLAATIARDRPALVIEVAPYAKADLAPAVAAFRKRRIAELEGTLRDLGYQSFARIIDGDRPQSVSTLDPGTSVDVHEMDYLCLA